MLFSGFKKLKIAAPLFLGLILLLAPKVALGQGILNPLNALFDITFGVIGKIFFGVAWIIAALAGIAIAIEAWLLGFILQVNTQIVNSPPVAVGFPVALSLANLALVFAIVVIAIMTILRVQTYGVKQTLWKLIVIAIAINFGLVIAGVILQFFDSLSFYFLDSINPAGGAGGQSGFSSFVNFSSALAGAFNPQRSFLKLQDNPANIELGKLAAGFGASIGSLITPVTSLVFTVFALIFIIITLGALIVMLIIRYVYLGYLLILLPLAWASWIFPATKNHWDKWWHNFLNQAAFAPIVLFFIWVAIQTSYAMNSSGDPYSFGKYYESNSNPVWAAVSEFFTNLFDPVIKQLLQIAILLGVMIGGLFAAKSMSIKFADTAAGMATGTAAWFGNKVGRWRARKGIQAGTAVARTEPARKFAQKLLGIGAGSTGVRGRLLRGAAATTGLRALGGGLDRLAAIGAEKAVEKADKEVLGDLTDQQIADRMATYDAPTLIAALKRLHKNGNLDMVTNLQRYLAGSDANKALFARYNQQDFLETARGEESLTLIDRLNQEIAAGSTDDQINRAMGEEMKKAKNAAALVKRLLIDQTEFNKLKGAGRDITGSADYAAFQEVQKRIMAGLALGASASAAATFYTAAAKGGQLDIARDAMRNSGVTRNDVQTQNAGLHNWFDSSPGARNLGVGYGTNNNGIA